MSHHLFFAGHLFLALAVFAYGSVVESSRTQ